MRLLQGKKINWIVLAIFFGVFAVFTACLIFPELLSAEQQENIMNRILIVCVCFMVLGVGWVPCVGLLLDGNILAMVTIVVCFVPIFLLRWRLPDGARKMLYYIPLICFMVGWVCCHPLFSVYLFANEMFYYCIPFYLCFMPALVGLTLGMMVRHWRS